MDTDYEPVWVRTAWTRDALESERVQFVLTRPGEQVAGVGLFTLRQRPSGEQCVEIIVTTATTPSQMLQRRFMLHQTHTDRIQRHPEPATAEFQLLA